MCKQPDSTIASFSHPVTAYNPEINSLCSVNIRNSRTQIKIVGLLMGLSHGQPVSVSVKKWFFNWNMFDSFNRLYQIWNGQRQYCMIFLDLQKAFDTLDHTILHIKKFFFFFFFMKLQASAIGNDILTWCSSLIPDRQQLVDVAGTHSTTAPRTYGVPLRSSFMSNICQ
jgi:hypothetical protein